VLVTGSESTSALLCVDGSSSDAIPLVQTVTAKRGDAEIQRGRGSPNPTATEIQTKEPKNQENTERKERL
jgi:hypothetical protein